MQTMDALIAYGVGLNYEHIRASARYHQCRRAKDKAALEAAKDTAWHNLEDYWEERAKCFDGMTMAAVLKSYKAAGGLRDGGDVAVEYAVGIDRYLTDIIGFLMVMLHNRPSITTTSMVLKEETDHGLYWKALKHEERINDWIAFAMVPGNGPSFRRTVSLSDMRKHLRYVESLIRVVSEKRALVVCMSALPSSSKSELGQLGAELLALIAKMAHASWFYE